MTTNTLTCAYKIRAVGAVSVASLAARFAAVPVDMGVLNLCGLLYDSDATVTAGQDVTRTITVRATPTSDATATATLFPGLPSGSPLDALTLTGGGHDYAAPPIISVSGGGAGVARQPIITAQMGVDRAIIIAGGVGYSAPTVVFTGGQLAPGGVQATATATQAAGAINSVTIVTAGGPYLVPPIATVVDPTGSGAVLSPSLLVTGLTLVDPSEGFTAAPTIAFGPFFANGVCPDTFPDTQKAHLKNFMTQVFQAALRMPIIEIDPTIP